MVASAQNPEEEIWDAISSFEQILEALPDDRPSLETLSSAYEQIGDHARAKEYLVRLAEVVLREADHSAAAALLDRLKVYAEYDSKIGELIGQIEANRGAGEVGGRDSIPPASAVEGAAVVQGALSKFSIAAEMSMAWNLMEAKVITQDEYALVVQDLTELSSQHGSATVSTLHVLEARSGIDLEHVLSFLSRECGTPIIALDNFEFNLATTRLLPRDFMVERGVVVFELLGPDALVAILNPYDSDVRKDVKALLARDCHFYIVPASQFDRRIERLDDALIE